MEDDLTLEQVTADLEKSITAEELDLKDPETLKKAIIAAATKAASDVLAKAKGAQPTTLPQEEKPKKKTQTETESDPAEKPVKSGKGYKDSSHYTKGDEEGDDDDGDNDDDKGKDKRPSYFGGKGKGKGKGKDKGKDKAEKGEESEDADVTETIEEMAKALDDIGDRLDRIESTQDHLKKGSAIFGEVLHGIAENDPRKDNLTITMAKALQTIVGRLDKIEKGIAGHNDLIKSIAEMPGAPRVAGLALIKGEPDPAPGVDGQAVSKEDRERLYKAAVEKKISLGEYKTALSKGGEVVTATLKKAYP